MKLDGQARLHLSFKTKFTFLIFAVAVGARDCVSWVSIWFELFNFLTLKNIRRLTF